MQPTLKGSAYAEKRVPSLREPGLQLGRAVAVAARPRLFAGQVAAPAARVGVLHFLERQILLPVLPLLLERRRTEAHLDPSHPAVVISPRGVHVPDVFVAGNRAPAKRAVGDGVAQRLLLPWLDASGDEITHQSPSSRTSKSAFSAAASPPGRWTCSARRPAVSSDWKSPMACASSSVPKEKDSPGMGTSSRGAAVTTRKTPVSAPPLWSWPVECKYRGPYPNIVAARVCDRTAWRNAAISVSSVSSGATYTSRAK